MKYCVVCILLLAIVSCVQKRSDFSCFHDEVQDSAYLDLHAYVLPASAVTLCSALKAGDKYYLTISEEDRPHREGSKDMLIEVSAKSHKSRFIPIPDTVSSFYSFSAQNDTLVIRDGDDVDFVFDSKSCTWTKRKTHTKPSYEDEDYIVQYEDHGEFGDAMWFIDKCSGDEHAFVNLSGRVCRLRGKFYIVNRTRIYEVADPSIGFHCDSLTNYAAVKGIRMLAHHFGETGYYNDDHNILPIIHLDNESADVEKRDVCNGMCYYAGGFGVSEYAKADTNRVVHRVRHTVLCSS